MKLIFHLSCIVFLTILNNSQNSVGQSITFGENSIERILLGESGTEKKNFRVPEARFRLPNSFQANHYDIQIRPILENMPGDSPQWTAPGHVVIFGICLNATSSITLHSQVAVNETSVKVTNLATLQEVPIVGHSYDEEKTFYIIELGQSLSPGVEYSIHIEYVAEVYLDNLEGMYRNHYDDPVTGETKYSIATQLQAFGARKVFPCLDEPAMKATFGITLGRKSNYSTISNSPIVLTTPIPGMNGWFWDITNITVKMPTYLVAIIISDFTYEEASSELYHKPVRTYGPKHLIDAGFGIIPSEIAAKVISFFGEFFQVDYQMHKMDSVALNDFPAGAMENWGLNIYKQDYLLYSDTQKDERSRRGVALTLNHELAHQWTGNLITCDWWTMAWLNEGFATYLSYQGMEYTNPEFEAQKAIQFDCVQNAMRNDARDDAHPTVLPDKGNPWDTMTYNANLVYSKGAALLRMMEGFLTLGTLQKGLQAYMKALSFQAANQDQLFEILTVQANADNRLPIGVKIKDIMDTFTLQKGYPVVNVNLGNNSVTFTQEEYNPDNVTRLYYIPIATSTQSYPNSNDPSPRYWLFQQPNGIEINHNPDEWIVVNSLATGYYRVLYDEVLAKKLQDQLVANHEMISLGSRSQLMDDYFTYAFDKKASVQTALEFTKYLSKEVESSVWNAFFFHMSKPRRLILHRPTAQSFKNYLVSRVSGALTELKNSGANLAIGAANLFYVQLVDWAVAVGEQRTLELAMEYYDQWKLNSSENPIPPLLRQSIHCSAVQGPTDENFLFALNCFGTETPASQATIIQGLACRTDPRTLEMFLGVVTGSTTQIPKSFSQSVLSSAAAVYNNFGNIIPFLINNFDKIVEYHGSPRIIANAIGYLGSSHSSASELSIIKTFIEVHNNKFTDPEDLRILNNAVATLENNIQWMRDFGDDMSKWFDDNN